METIALVNGRIHTPSGVKEAVVIKAGRVAEVGKTSEMLNLRPSSVFDLKDKSVFPGFSDSHMHFMSWAESQELLDLSSCRSIEEIRICLKTFMERHPLSDTEWYCGGGWNHVYIAEGRMPTKQDLDDLSPKNPVILRRICGHVAVLNTIALERLGWGSETDIPGGVVELGEDGEPNGIVCEEAVARVTEQIPALQNTDLERLLEKYGPRVAAMGLTHLNSDDMAMFDFDFRRAIRFYMHAAEEGRLPFRVRQQFLLPNHELLLDFLSEGWRSGDGVPFYQIGPLKLLCDGSLGGRTAFLRTPYADAPDIYGVPIYEQVQLNQLVETAHASGMQIATHAIGDAALEMCLDAFEHAQTQNPSIMRHLVVHAQIADDGQLDRMKRLRLGAAIQPTFVPSDREMAIERLGNEWASHCYRWKTMLRKGIALSAGSDAPVEKLNPLLGIHAAVTRQDAFEKPAGGWVPEEKLSLAEALSLYTWSGAWHSGTENRRGEIASGQDADLVVLEQDPFLVAPEELPKIDVMMTLCGGRITHLHKDFNF